MNWTALPELPKPSKNNFYVCTPVGVEAAIYLNGEFRSVYTFQKIKSVTHWCEITQPKK